MNRNVLLFTSLAIVGMLNGCSSSGSNKTYYYQQKQVDEKVQHEVTTPSDIGDVQPKTLYKKRISQEQPIQDIRVDDYLHYERGGQTVVHGTETFSPRKKGKDLQISLPTPGSLSKKDKQRILKLLNKKKWYYVNGLADYAHADYQTNLFLANARMEEVYTFMKQHHFQVQRGHAYVTGNRGVEYRVAIIEEQVR